MYKTKRQREQEIFDSINKDYISLASVEEMKLLTRGKVMELIKTGKIKSMKFKHKVYIGRKGLFEIIKNK
jgi:hypothetical protein